ncbi:hypothetical protein JXA88_12365 [Candidatus Fermentibacteria bacterium]|nr:hypothetical protein [Candidatus Fermentibacteria bacterium]
MSLEEKGIQHKELSPTLAATTRFVLEKREELPAVFARFAGTIPTDAIAGPPFVIINFITPVKDGSDVEAGYPVTRAVEGEGITTRLLPATPVLSLVHEGGLDGIGGAYRTLFSSAYSHGLISDEFCREVYHDLSDPTKSRIEVQFVIHDWERLFRGNLDRVLGSAAMQAIMVGQDVLTVESAADERFAWAKGAVQRVDETATEFEKYEVLSRCAHVFPAEQVERLRAVYEEAREATGNGLLAVDAVLEFMENDPVWGRRPYREGRTIFSTKNPRDPKAFEQATTPEEKRKAACFCTIIRQHMEEGMSPTFCYCSSGWERRQWEGAIGRPVRVDVVKTLLRGDDHCQFAIHLPEDL